MRIVALLLCFLLLSGLVSAMGYFNYVSLWKSQRPNHFAPRTGYVGSVAAPGTVRVSCGLQDLPCCQLPSGRLGCYKVPSHVVMCMPDNMCHKVS